MNIQLSIEVLSFNRLVSFSTTYVKNNLLNLDTDKLLITRQQFNTLANDAMMNSKLNSFFAEGVKIMRENKTAYTDLNLINLYLKQNNIAQVEIIDD